MHVYVRVCVATALTHSRHLTAKLDRALERVVFVSPKQTDTNQHDEKRHAFTLFDGSGRGAGGGLNANKPATMDTGREREESWLSMSFRQRLLDTQYRYRRKRDNNQFGQIMASSTLDTTQYSILYVRVYVVYVHVRA